MRKLLTQVQQHLGADAAIMHAEAARGAYADCQASTHRLKSMLMFLCGERLRADFERLEDALRQAPLSVDPALLLLRERLNQFDAELADALARLP
ncbi:hypothetical protein [Duganella violaceipulchra]|uniref:HPt domain-containing protein n=1 Tax=Duganella violaceipulchra TaxID=2849652 RepID=A0AA41L2I7_9BURK|nr:hypothetical protein [Duganella violaceicalia]MBV6322468.1 hypothetical protein [Duganella violaceicalia]MCP2010673.1 hypothetical protein [Duganella violaceicalia]